MAKIDHIALVVEEPSIAAKWYECNFNAEVLFSDYSWALAEFENIKIAFVKKGAHPTHIAFEVENFDDIEGKEKTHRDGSKSVYKSDPWGNIYELINYEYEK